MAIGHANAVPYRDWMYAYRPTAENSRAPLAASLGEACAQWSDRPAITFAGTTITYSSLWRQVLSLAGAYERLSIGPGDRVLCQLRNCPKHVVAIGGAWARGGVHIGADNDLTGAELSRLVERLGAKALLYQPPHDRPDDLSPLDEVKAAHPALHVIVHGSDPGSHLELSTLLQSEPATRVEAADPLAPSIVFLTSGTTGEPKTVLESLAAHWAKMQLFTDGFEPGTDDVHLLYLPLSHVFGFRLGLLALLRGGRLVLMERFSPERALELIGQEHVTVLPAVPTHLRLLHERYDRARHDISSLRWVLSAAANLPQELAEWVYRDLGARMMFVYGCSEGFTTVTSDEADILAGSVGSRVFQGPPGTPADGVVRVVDPDSGTTVRDGENGEIWYGAATPVAYWDLPPVAVDGWYRTGDLGCVDADGRLHVTGRLKELINRGGLHVSTSEVELAMAGHPGIADGAVIPVPDRVLGEAVCACVVPAGKDAPDLGELRTFLGATLARHKLPDELCVVAAIPRTDIGKVDRRALAAEVLAGAVPRQRLR